MIRKLGTASTASTHGNRSANRAAANLGTFKTLTAVKKHERAAQSSNGVDERCAQRRKWG
jgi:hypothetical protein